MSYYSRRNKYRSYNSYPTWVGVVAIIILIIALCIELYRPFDKISDMREVTVTVTDKDVKNYGKNNSKYLVFTEDLDGNIMTFEITDSVLKGRFNSSDIYAGIKLDKTYKLTIGGSRVEILSWYPNIYEYEEVKCE